MTFSRCSFPSTLHRRKSNIYKYTLWNYACNSALLFTFCSPELWMDSHLLLFQWPPWWTETNPDLIMKCVMPRGIMCKSLTLPSYLCCGTVSLLVISTEFKKMRLSWFWVPSGFLSALLLCKTVISAYLSSWYYVNGKNGIRPIKATGLDKSSLFWRKHSLSNINLRRGNSIRGPPTSHIQQCKWKQWKPAPHITLPFIFSVEVPCAYV